MSVNFKMCLVGCGGVSHRYHGPSFMKYRENNPGFVTAACCDLDIEKAERHKQDIGFLRAYTDLHEMIETEKPDAVCVVVAASAAASVCLQVMEHGVPLMTEKPPGISIDEIDQLIEVSERKKISNMVAFNRRNTPLIVECRKLIEEINDEILYVR